jgi:hypothetical protein
MENKELYLYKIWIGNESAVVCAESIEEAKRINCGSKEANIEFLGVASILTKKGVIISSYNG